MAEANAIKKILFKLHQEIKKENAEVVAELLQQIPIDHQITDSGMTALALACSQTQNHSVILAIDNYGPNPNAADLMGRTPLHHAAITSNIACIDYLTRFNQQNPNILQIDALTRGRETPLMFAVRSGNNDVVIKILELKANPFILNGMGQSATNLAFIYNPFLVDTLQNAVFQWT